MVKTPRGPGRSNEQISFLEISKFIQNKQDVVKVKKRMTRVSILNWVNDYGNFIKTFDFFLDNLLCYQLQNSNNSTSPPEDYQQFLHQDTANIRQSCKDFILRRIHNSIFEKIPVS